MFTEYAGLGDRALVGKTKLVAKICQALKVHTRIEEEIFYPAMRAASKDAEDMVDEAVVEHASAKDLIAQLEAMGPEEDLYDAKVKVLGELIDNHDGREMMAAMLEAWDYTVLQAADGLAGVALAHANVPQVALIDIGLPGIDGYEVARRLRQSDATSTIKMIALTGYGLADDQKRVLEACADEARRRYRHGRHHLAGQ